MQDGQSFARVVAKIHEVVRNAAERIQAASRLAQPPGQKLGCDVKGAGAMTEQAPTLTHIGVGRADLMVVTHGVELPPESVGLSLWPKR